MLSLVSSLYFGIVATNYGHSMSQTMPGFFIGTDYHNTHIEYRDMGRSVITDKYIRYRHIHGILISKGRNFRLGGYLYDDKAGINFAPYFSFGKNFCLSYFHAIRDEDSSSHAWMLEFKMEVK